MVRRIYIVDKHHFTKLVERHLAERGYRLDPPQVGFDIEAAGTRERLLVDVRAAAASESKLWSSFVGAVSRATLLQEQARLRGTVCLAFSEEYGPYLGEHLGRIDPRVVVLYLDSEGDLRRLRGTWDVTLEGDPFAYAPTIVARVPETPIHPDGRFVIGEIAYDVKNGRVVWATEGGSLLFPPPTFMDLCRRVGLTAATDTAPAVMFRAARKVDRAKSA